MMFMKVTIKIVAFFLGHPVYGLLIPTLFTKRSIIINIQWCKITYFVTLLCYGSN